MNYKYLVSISINLYIDKLANIVDKYNKYITAQSNEACWCKV